ncbi:MAG: DEAD/DEAH box helicase family protein [Flavobacteriales bacterium]|nr:MAG: DEAD/DEAH box helicase family protein [Flavobacteriales bacterium]
MSKVIKLHFDPSQPHQLRAVECTAQLLEGLPQFDSALYKKALSESGQLGLQNDVVGNIPPAYQLDEDWLLDNLNAVRRGQRDWLEPAQLIQETMTLDVDDGDLLDVPGVEGEAHRYPVFTVEMETGTGKTYVYLRTIQELRKQYGLRKFIIVVPSVAIYEGVVKSFDTMREHFKGLYSNEVTHLIQYDSGQISQLRDFATSDKVEVLLMTVDSFNKASNNVYKATEKLQGEWKPYRYIQAVRPVLILDESQNYQSKRARQALRTLKPLLAINYSATPGKRENLFYRLGPLEAFQQGLVKKIEVVGVTEQYQYNNEQFSFSFVSAGRRTGVGPEVEADVTSLIKGQPTRVVLRFKKGDDLFDKTGNPAYKGLIIDEVSQTTGVLLFSNGDQVNVRDHGNAQEKEDIFRTQIEETIKHHFDKQKALLASGIKVLSLFFIDRVDNYVATDGLIRRLFDEAFEKLKKDYPYWKGWKAEEVREAYFAKRKAARGQAEQFVDTAIEVEEKTKADQEAEKAAYELIMKGKERLLNLDEKVAFIFAHSALKEGWDNPNVFQICTLNQTTSEAKKRQEIGRGLRLAVDQSGQRVMSEQVNVLTVVANESYERFADALQKEYTEAGQLAPPKPTNARRYAAKRNERVYKSKAFRAFWDKLMQQAEYEILVEPEAVVEACVAKLNAEQFPEPHIVVTRGEFVMSTISVELMQVSAGLAKLDVSISNTAGESRSSTQWFRTGDELARKLNEPRLKGYKLVAIEGEGNEARVLFGDKGELAVGQQHQFQVREENRNTPSTRLEAQATHPVFNLIDRAAQETKLTRRTIRTIFERMHPDKKQWVFRNPEGFSGVFVRTIRDLLADHIAERVQYHLKKEKQDADLEAMFPPEKKYAQKELIEGSDASMYDWVQVDSDVEKHFVQLRLNGDGKVKGYLKFPAGFKINMPKIIQDYNPDWGVLREDEQKPEVLMELVRETKGTTQIENLQWGHEKRKIKLAKKYFAALGIDYRTVDDKVVRWWEKG